ncbi:U4/U6 small nuclear ribonucleoprotein SNU13 [Nematocida displodere]|uniref:H/ACA ribonucleoprotein complex subunit 2 n=1 Tax=Nematocida displodere TaxID=1805483 RepID=A0A177EKV2_9MICR|nr:U4/U6 small nuclear ribonucleoprotein SNU13 [Nematocida displodere]
MARAHDKKEKEKDRSAKKERSEKKESSKTSKTPKTEEKTSKAPAAKANPKATPLCTDKVTKKVYSLIALAKSNGLLKIGVNEVIKRLNKGDAELVFLAGDAKPFAIVEPIVHLCENKNRTFYFVPSTSSLGKACGLTRPVAGCVVMYSEQSSITKLVSEIRDQMSNV